MNDHLYYIEIAAGDLDQFTERVRKEEQGAAQFIDNRLSSGSGSGSDSGEWRNLASFTAPNGKPAVAQPTFAEFDAAPADKIPVWTGVVLAGDGRHLAVQMVR